MAEIKVDKTTCIGCKLCANICSEVFEMREDKKAHVKAQKDLPCVDDAIDSCPVEAISKE